MVYGMSNVWRAIGAPWVVGTGRGGVPEARRQVLHTASLSQKGGERTSLFGRFTFSFSLLGLHAATVHVTARPGPARIGAKHLAIGEADSSRNERETKSIPSFLFLIFPSLF